MFITDDYHTSYKPTLEKKDFRFISATYRLGFINSINYRFSLYLNDIIKSVVGDMLIHVFLDSSSLLVIIKWETIEIYSTYSIANNSYETVKSSQLCVF